MRWPLALAAGILAVAASLLAGCGQERVAKPPPRADPQGTGSAWQPLSQRSGGLRGRPLAARLVRRVRLRERPGGRVVRALGMRTGFGSPRMLAVVARRGRWLAVLSEHLPNSRAGWIPAAGAQLLVVPYELQVDVSARLLVVQRHGRTVRRVSVAVGRPGTTTPTGRFAVTDALRVERGSPYGCCVLALTGRQPNVPRGWPGGDRLAIHGTPNEATIGTAASSGCLRAAEREMRWLMSRVPLGTPVRIRA
ncbi:MAG TPA: L,D-transpeptidase [Solirubrobacteraceae bacterium]|nr:L,D-transpeptidase [Solirubrobacteraceae bacterium]